MLTIDGSTLEGGGQLTRVALSLSAITRIPIRIINIRANRAPRSSRSNNSTTRSERHSRVQDRGGKDKGNGNGRIDGGLKESHLAALNWLAFRSNAKVQGDELGSREVVFRPAKTEVGYTRQRRVRGVEKDRVDGGCGCETIIDEITLAKPGSVWLVFQAIFPYMVFASRPRHSCEHKNTHHHHHRDDLQHDPETKLTSTPTARPIYDVTISGGTHVPKSMSTDYMTQVFQPICESIGLPRLQITPITQGWTTGGTSIGKVNIKIFSSPPPIGTASDTEFSTNTDTDTETETETRAPFHLPFFSLTDRGTITKLEITTHTSDTATTSAIQNALVNAVSSTPSLSNLPISIHPSSTSSSGDPRRLYVLLVAHTSSNSRLGVDYLYAGGRFRDVNDVIREAVRTVLRELVEVVERGGCVDEFMVDQIVIFLALGTGGVVFGGDCDDEDGNANVDWNENDHDHDDEDEHQRDESGSLHARTVRWVCTEMLSDRGLQFRKGGRCRGVAWNSHALVGRDVINDDYTTEELTANESTI